MLIQYTGVQIASRENKYLSEYLYQANIGRGVLSVRVDGVRLKDTVPLGGFRARNIEMHVMVSPRYRLTRAAPHWVLYLCWFSILLIVLSISVVSSSTHEPPFLFFTKKNELNISYYLLPAFLPFT